MVQINIPTGSSDPIEVKIEESSLYINTLVGEARIPYHRIPSLVTVLNAVMVAREREIPLDKGLFRKGEFIYALMDDELEEGFTTFGYHLLCTVSGILYISPLDMRRFKPEEMVVFPHPLV